MTYTNETEARLTNEADARDEAMCGSYLAADIRAALEEIKRLRAEIARMEGTVYRVPDEAMVRLTAAALSGLLARTGIQPSEREQGMTVADLAGSRAVAYAAAALRALKEHGSEEFRPSASPGADDSAAPLAALRRKEHPGDQPSRPPPGSASDGGPPRRVTPSPGTEDAQARPSSPAPSARGAGARWIAPVMECSVCREVFQECMRAEHERSPCWAASPAVSARQDAGAGEEKPREGALKRLLDDLEAYFDNRADVDHNGERHVPNEAMVLRARVDSARADLLRRAPSSLRGEPVDIGEAPKFQGYHGLWMQGWDAARARALKMSSEPEAKS
jgi:hypothetical protein